jgi:class 3 adenylate cyclase
MGACIAGSRTPNPRATKLRNLGSHAVYGFGVRLERFSGREIKTTGDGFVATFPSAISALRCAVPIREGMSVLGLAVRIRVHTGEVEVVDEDIHGLNVHAAARNMARAGPSTTLASEITQSRRWQRCANSTSGAHRG